jgi:uncharacterized protein
MVFLKCVQILILMLPSSAHAGDPIALLEERHRNLGMATDQASWWRFHQEQALAGVAVSQCIVGNMLADGLVGVEPDEEQALLWFQKAADQGHLDAQYFLSKLLFRGRGVEKNEDLAMYWLLRAAEQNHTEAQFRLGLRLCVGRGIERDEAQAAYCFRKAVEQGHVGATLVLAVLVYEGLGVSMESEEALERIRSQILSVQRNIVQGLFSGS